MARSLARCGLSSGKLVPRSSSHCAERSTSQLTERALFHHVRDERVQVGRGGDQRRAGGLQRAGCHRKQQSGTKPHGPVGNYARPRG
eukprot:COSAG02_NODE_786_length_17199_cov_25.278889_15_plen_87_part_00